MKTLILTSFLVRNTYMLRLLRSPSFEICGCIGLIGLPRWRTAWACAEKACNYRNFHWPAMPGSQKATYMPYEISCVTRPKNSRCKYPFWNAGSTANTYGKFYFRQHCQHLWKFYFRAPCNNPRACKLTEESSNTQSPTGPNSKAQNPKP